MTHIPELPNKFNPVELFLPDVADVILQLGKLDGVVRPVGVCLGDILGQHGQLTHAIDSLLDFLDEPILRLREGNRVGMLVIAAVFRLI